MVAIIIGFDDVVILDDFPAFLTAMLIADAAAVLLMHLVHIDVVTLGGRVQLHRHVDETKRNRPSPNGSHPSIEAQTQDLG